MAWGVLSWCRNFNEKFVCFRVPPLIVKFVDARQNEFDEMTRSVIGTPAVVS